MSTLKSVEEWNAHSRATYVEPVLNFEWPKPKPLGAACPCGAELHDDPGNFWGSHPACQGVKCLVCAQRGYIKEWSQAPEIVLVAPNSKPQTPNCGDAGAA